MQRLFFILLVLSAFACQRAGDHADKMIFRYNESAGVSSLDPAYSRNLENIWVCNMLYNGLVEVDDSLNIKPSIAERWTIDSTGTIYRFYLRDDVFFHESEAFPNKQGRRVVASDFVYSFNRILDRKLSSPGSWVFGAVATENPFRAIGDSIVEIQLEKQFPPFLGLLGMKYCSVVPHEAVEMYGDNFRMNPVGTGPFKFNFWIENTRLVLIKNENYFEVDDAGANLPYLDAVSVSFIPDKSAAYLDLVKGNFDFMSGLHSSYADELITGDGELVELYSDRFYLQKHPFLKTDYLGFMVNDSLAKGSPWLNVDLRRAINYAINRADMVRYLRNNVYTPGTAGFIPKGMPGYRENSGFSYNPDSVRACIERAGYGNGKKLPKLTLSTTSDYVDLCEFVQHQVSQFGFEVKVDVLPASVHRELTARGEIEFFRKSWLADYPDDENFMALFYSPNQSPAGPNYSHFSDPAFDDLYLAALATTNQKERNKLYTQMDSLMMLQAPIVPLYYDVVMRFVSNKVSGLDESPTNILDLRHVKIELDEE